MKCVCALILVHVIVHYRQKVKEKCKLLNIKQCFNVLFDCNCSSKHATYLFDLPTNKVLQQVTFEVHTERHAECLLHLSEYTDRNLVPTDMVQYYFPLSHLINSSRGFPAVRCWLTVKSERFLGAEGPNGASAKKIKVRSNNDEELKSSNMWESSALSQLIQVPNIHFSEVCLSFSLSNTRTRVSYFSHRHSTNCPALLRVSVKTQSVRLS